ncbi:MAG TPA: hypothetical protein VFA16_23460 [Mycobacterium sp.]|uniref:hypothetical protein n=1 Tax=Mycobacterium sp. TaxID=1785 RepID=UPI002D4ADDEE|nr:hypothetical protein [Mycobacterium sp.]HZU50179.1 hypothetical protein [Mycobacterium sp.]
MHAMIRRYKMTGSMDELMHQVQRRFASQLSGAAVSEPVRVPAGILSYQAIRTGDDTLLTVTVFESADLLQRAQQGAADIRASLAEFSVEEIETYDGEVNVSYVSNTLFHSAATTGAADRQGNNPD